ncbi:MAG: hypothetical protein FWF15_04920, partial [Oscillospiraceae bacterium]|nr:hypothetical protein [Oscillospiraceae bacterium]
HLNGVTSGTYNGNIIYGWNWIWPTQGEMGFGGWQTKLLEASLLKDGTPIEFEQKGHRILLKNLPKEAPDKNASVSVIKLVFEERPSCIFASYYPQMHAGREWTTEKI